jgi:hypothetical protein
MKWFNASKDSLPRHEQEVLISVNGIYYVAHYDSTANAFRLKDQPSDYFQIGEYVIYWTALGDPV